MANKHLIIFVAIFEVVWTSPQFNQGMDSPTIWGNRQESDYDTNAYEGDYFVNYDHASENDGEMLDGNLDAFLQNPGWLVTYKEMFRFNFQLYFIFQKINFNLRRKIKILE